VEAVRSQLDGCSAAVNAAGVSDAAEADLGTLMAANAALPGVIARAANGMRFVHVSSAAVQGRTPTLDSTHTVNPFSPYSVSKSVGELAVHRFMPDAIIYRPAGVHGADRTVTRTIARIARSSAACVAAPGMDPTAQSLIENVADAIAYLTLVDLKPPAVVAHPGEGITTSELMEYLGGKRPRQIPRSLATASIAAAYRLGRQSGPIVANARRLEMLWLGQKQSASWLTHNGWEPRFGVERWRALGTELRDDKRR
jgi:dTDP-4-dehydrorhamnose reductase